MGNKFHIEKFFKNDFGFLTKINDILSFKLMEYIDTIQIQIR